MLGGTLPYMAPEHLDAFNPHGSTPPEAVDERSDLYALGLILFEMVAGRHPFPEPPPGRPLLEVVRLMTEERRGPAPSPRAINPRGPPGPRRDRPQVPRPRPRPPPRPGRRPGRGPPPVPRRPPAEVHPRAQPRRARWPSGPGGNPRLTSGSTVAPGGARPDRAGRRRRLDAPAGHLRQVSARLKLRVFEPRFQECQFLLNTAGGPADEPGPGDRPGRGGDPPGRRRRPGRPGRRSWLGGRSPRPSSDEVRRDLAELILLAARARVVQAERSRSEPKRRQALEAGVARLDRAEAARPEPAPGPLRRPGPLPRGPRARPTEAARDRARRRRDRRRPPAATSTCSAPPHLAAGPARPRRAGPAPGRRARPPAVLGLVRPGALPLRPGAVRRGGRRLRRLHRARAPKFAWPWMNRGLALARAGRLVEAREAYDRALAVDARTSPRPWSTGAWPRLELGDAAGRRRPTWSGPSPWAAATPSIRAALAEALARSGRPAEGLRLLDDLIEADPDAPLPRVARGTIRLATDPKGAEADFRRVLAVDPRHAGAHLGLARLLRVRPPGRARPRRPRRRGRPRPARRPRAPRPAPGPARRPARPSTTSTAWSRPRPRTGSTTPPAPWPCWPRPGPTRPSPPGPSTSSAGPSNPASPPRPLRDDPDLESLRADPAFPSTTAPGPAAPRAS